MLMPASRTSELNKMLVPGLHLKEIGSTVISSGLPFRRMSRLADRLRKCSRGKKTPKIDRDVRMDAVLRIS